MLTIIYYHSIGLTKLSLPINIFKLQIENILKRNARVLTLKDFFANEYDKKENIVVLTFDDCFMDIYEYALPIMIHYGVPGTFFAVPGYDHKILWGSEKYQRWSANKDNDYNIPFSYMGIKERKKIISYGMEIGCHTFNHTNLDSLSKEGQKIEILESKKYLETELGTSITSFCYPRGKYNLTTIELLKKSGYKAACNTHKGYYHIGSTDNYEIPRFGAPTNMWEFNSILDGQNGNINIFQKIKKKLILKLI